MTDEQKLERIDKQAVAEYFPDIFMALSQTGDGAYSYICNIEEDFSIWSKEAVDYFGLPSPYMKKAGEIWMEHLALKDRKAYEQNVSQLFSGETGVHDMVYHARNRDGNYVTCSCKGKVIRNKNGNPKYFTGTIVNNENKKLIDPVTGLYSREELLVRLEEGCRQADDRYLLAFGVHNFFDVNNSYGYDFGNKVLKAVAEYARNIQLDLALFRPEGTKIFALLDAKTYPLDVLLEVFRKARDYFKNSLCVDGVHISLDICGVLILLDDFFVDVNTIYNNTLYALDKAKRKNMHELFVVDSELFQGSRKHLQVLDAIRESIYHGFCGFFLCYQPIIRASTGKVSGMEALLRWKSKEQGLVPPNEFIPWLEQDPVFYELGNWIIRQAVHDTKQILKDRPDFIVNVNLAYPQLQREDFKPGLARILQEEGFPADNLKLELTERCRLIDTDTLRSDMEYFKSTGMQTALDDFGTGYAALNLLTELPVDQVKIDKSFIDDIETDVPRQSLLRALTGCAAELGKTICVEGIETQEMADYIRSNFQVSYFQGYFYSKPVTIDKFVEWMNRSGY